jgi:L-2,4-diaminobutyric acid acetyltransferase
MQVREPTAKDFKAARALVSRVGTLSMNSEYCFALLCDHFRHTCRITEGGGGQIVGWLSAYRRPDDSAVLFVWQVGVDPDHRGAGIATAMLRSVVDSSPWAQRVEATVSASNTASRSLFERLAADYGTVLNRLPSSIGAELEDTDAEDLFQVVLR